MVMRQPSKLVTRVRFPSPALAIRSKTEVERRMKYLLSSVNRLLSF